MISQSIAESPLNITSVLNSFKYFIKQVYQKNGPKILKRKRFKMITPEEKKAKRRKNKLHLSKKRRLNFKNSENLLFRKVNLPTHICPARNWQSFLIWTHYSNSKWKNILHTLKVYKIPAKEHNITSILNNFKSFIKQKYHKQWT